MKSTRRQFLSQTVKAGLAVLAGVLGGAALVAKPKPTYEVPASTEAERQYAKALTEGPWFLTPDEKRQALQRHLATRCPFTIEVHHGECGEATNVPNA